MLLNSSYMLKTGTLRDFIHEKKKKREREGYNDRSLETLIDI